FVLAGLLPALAADLGVPPRQAGGLTSAYALGMVVGAPVMAALARRLSPPWALTAFLLLFVLAHVVGAVTDAFAVLLTARVVAAVANAGFLAVALSTVAAVVPAERRARGLAVVLAGVTLALVAGAPAGALLGGQLGWRATMWAIAAVSAPALVAVAVGTPTRPAGDGAPPARALDELAVLRRPRLQVTLALAVLVNSATFGTLTFLAVLATSRAGLPEALTPGLLAAFGVGALGGVTAASRLVRTHRRRSRDAAARGRVARDGARVHRRRGDLAAHRALGRAVVRCRQRPHRTRHGAGGRRCDAGRLVRDRGPQRRRGRGAAAVRPRARAGRRRRGAADQCRGQRPRRPRVVAVRAVGRARRAGRGLAVSALRRGGSGILARRCGLGLRLVGGLGLGLVRGDEVLDVEQVRRHTHPGPERVARHEAREDAAVLLVRRPDRL